MCLKPPCCFNLIVVHFNLTLLEYMSTVCPAFFESNVYVLYLKLG